MHKNSIKKSGRSFEKSPSTHPTRGQSVNRPIGGGIQLAFLQRHTTGRNNLFASLPNKRQKTNKSRLINWLCRVITFRCSRIRRDSSGRCSAYAMMKWCLMTGFDAFIMHRGLSGARIARSNLLRPN